jgi:Protein of unknown function (DUF3108)
MLPLTCAALLFTVIAVTLPSSLAGGFPGACPQATTERAKASAPKKSTRPAAPTVAKETIMPFRVGETLNYRVAWASFTTAASLQLSVPERRNLFAWPTWHLRAALHTQSPVRTIFAVDDEFDSYADASGLDTRRYETYQSELGRKEDRVMHFIAVGQKPWGSGPDVVVLPGTHDPVSALYALRQVDWQRTSEWRIPVYDGREIYQLTAKLDAKTEMISVAAGTFSTERVNVKLSQNSKQNADIIFEVWLANNATRIPVQFQAQLPFGSIRAELIPGDK